MPKNVNTIYYKVINRIISNWVGSKKFHGYKFLASDLFKDFKKFCFKFYIEQFNKDCSEHNKNVKCFDTISIKHFHRLKEFLLDCGIFEIVSYSHKKDVLMPIHFGIVEYGFSLELKKLWQKNPNSMQLIELFKTNIFNPFMTEPLKYFIREISDPYKFIQFIKKTTNETNDKQNILLAELLPEIENTNEVLSEKERILKILIKQIYKSNSTNTYDNFNILQAIGKLEGIVYLKRLFLSSLKRSKILEAKLDWHEFIETTEKYNRLILVENIAYKNKKSTIFCLKELLKKENDFFVIHELVKHLSMLGETEYVISYLFEMFQILSDRQKDEVLHKN